jgi:hypothetical protein
MARPAKAESAAADEQAVAAAPAPSPVIVRRPASDYTFHVRGLKATTFDTLERAVAAAAQLSSDSGTTRVVEVIAWSRRGASDYGGSEAIEAYDRQRERLRAFGLPHEELVLECHEITCKSSWSHELELRHASP